MAIAALAAIALARSAAAAYPLADMAVTEIYVREALAGRLIEGPYSHFPWHHPGPFYFYFLAPIYAAGAERSAALNAGAFALALASACGIFWATRRARIPYMTAVIAGGLAAYVIRVDGLLVSAWNPHVVILPAAAALVAAGLLAGGDSAMLPLVIVGASLAVQTHVALAPTMLAAAATGLGLCYWNGSVSWRHLGVAAALLFVLWLPSIIEQSRNDPGNLRALWQFFATSARHGQSSQAAASAWSQAMTAIFHGQMALPIGGAMEEAPLSSAVGGVFLAAATAAAAAAAFWAGKREIGRFAAVLAVASVVSLWSVGGVEGPIRDHQVFWISIVGTLDAAAILMTIVTFALPRTARPAMPTDGHGLVAVWLVCLVFLVVGLGQMNRARLGSAPVTITLPSVANFGASIERYIDGTSGRKALVRIDQDEWGVAAGILLQLSRLGVRFAVEDDWASMFPRSFRARGDEQTEITIEGRGDRADLAERRGDYVIDRSTRVEVHAIPIAQRLGPPAGERNP